MRDRVGCDHRHLPEFTFAHLAADDLRFVATNGRPVAIARPRFPRSRRRGIWLTG